MKPQDRRWSEDRGMPVTKYSSFSGTESMCASHSKLIAPAGVVDEPSKALHHAAVLSCGDDLPVAETSTHPIS